MHYYPLPKAQLAQANLATLNQTLPLQQIHPKIPIPLTGNFEWLGLDDQPVYERDPRYEFEARLTHLKQEAQQKKLTIPPSFQTFMGHQKMLQRIRSRGAYYFDLGECLTTVTPESPIHLLRFYSESEYCGHWYLALDQQGNSCVVYSDDYYGEGEEELFGDRRNTFEYGTPTFEAFIFRYWMETRIEEKKRGGWEELSGLELAYLGGINL